jgi:hypothetical protein
LKNKSRRPSTSKPNRSAENRQKPARPFSPFVAHNRSAIPINRAILGNPNKRSPGQVLAKGGHIQRAKFAHAPGRLASLSFAPLRPFRAVAIQKASTISSKIFCQLLTAGGSRCQRLASPQDTILLPVSSPPKTHAITPSDDK